MKERITYHISRFTYHFSLSRGFSLIELLVAIAIIAMIIGLALPNYLGARQRARDTRRKAEIQQLRNALQLYFTDYRTYPADVSGNILGCGASGTGTCPCSTSLDFAAGGSGCDTVYMAKFPSDFGSGGTMSYYQRQSGAAYCLIVPLENASDADLGFSQDRCASVCSGLYSATGYVACSE